MEAKLREPFEHDRKGNTSPERREKHRLFIGEAKLESALGSDSDHVLVHQLIRQYVMARILFDVLVNRAVYDSREVVPFVVVEDADYTRRTSQIRFMVDQKWLRPENVLSWHGVAGLTP